ncbi:MAG: hypothetical protein ACJ8CB_21595, partial [Ktedonobacteraceae bacterium]
SYPLQKSLSQLTELGNVPGGGSFAERRRIVLIQPHCGRMTRSADSIFSPRIPILHRFCALP